MKRFVFIVVFLLVAVFAVFYATYSKGIYIDLHKDAAISVPFRAEGKELEFLTEVGTYQGVTLRGVDISSGLAGHYASDLAAEEEDYYRWLEYIHDMGANALRVTKIMDSDFYNALYEYNTTHDQPFYLLQGISVSDYANNNANDSYQTEFFYKLMDDGEAVVDIIHGRKMVISTDANGDMYLKDVSEWVIGFLVGAEWVSETIAYTNNNHLRPNTFKGNYFYTSPEATPFEAMLAQVMENLIDYETKKYKTQRPIGFISDPENDFLEYETVYAKQLHKYVQLDAENVLYTDAMKAGTFAAYRLYDFCDDFAGYLTREQTAELAPILNALDHNGVYGGYLRLISRYHSMPVVATGFGFSSSRGAVRMEVAPLNEKEQGENLVEFSVELEEENWAGGFISSWQDSWEQWTWNTQYSSMGGGNYLWHDLQTEGVNYGLMSFDPGKEARACVIDGSAEEWSEDDIVHTSIASNASNDIEVGMKYDEEGLYLLVKKPNISPTDKIYIPLDILPNTGTKTSETPFLTFDRDVDFIVSLTGEKSSRLLVHEYSDSTRQRFLAEMTGGNPYISIPDSQSPVFKTVYMVTANTLIFDEITVETRALQRNKTWDTGRLTHGNGDPTSEDYDSLTDFCYGEGLVEVRLPWMLLNFYDPPTMQVHDNYYEKYGVDGVYINRIYVGIAESIGESVSMSQAPIKGWGRKVDYHERLKQSYYIVKKGWLGE